MGANFWENDPVAMPPMPAKSLGAMDQKRVEGMQEGLDEANNLADLSADFHARNRRTGTGGWLAIPGAATVSKALGLMSPDLSAMDRDSVQMATALRKPNMRLTQMEFGKFLGTSPNIQTAGPTNAVSDQQAQAARVGAAAKSTFYTHYLQKKGNLDGADAAWMQFRAQHFSPDLQTFSAAPVSDWNSFLKQKSAQARGGQPAANGATIDIFGRPVGP